MHASLCKVSSHPRVGMEAVVIGEVTRHVGQVDGEVLLVRQLLDPRHVVQHLVGLRVFERVVVAVGGPAD